MKAIQAATLNVARTFRKDKDYGSVEPGKIADLSIVEGDPLQDIWMTQNVKMVVMDGKVIDSGFTKYKNPIASFYSYQSLPLDLEISPLFLIEGSGPTTLKVRGQGGMWPFHRVMLNGEPLPTSFVSKESSGNLSRGDPKSGHVHRHAQVRRRSVPRVPSAHLVVGFKSHSADISIVSPELTKPPTRSPARLISVNCRDAEIQKSTIPALFTNESQSAGYHTFAIGNRREVYGDGRPIAPLIHPKQTDGTSESRRRNMTPYICSLIPVRFTLLSKELEN